MKSFFSLFHGPFYETYPHIGKVLPGMGYSEDQIKDLEETIRRSECDVAVIATLADLRRKITIGQSAVGAHYDFDIDLNPLIDKFVNERL